MLETVFDIYEEAESYRISVFGPDAAATTQPRPAVVLLQAGDWFLRPDADDPKPLARRVTASGFALVALPCPTRNATSLAALTDQCAARMGVVANRSHEMGIDPGHLYLAGFGPGAVLGVCLATQPDLLKAAGLLPDALQGVIAMSGLYDVSAACMHAPLKEWLNAERSRAPAELKNSSPLFHAASGAVGPPLLLAFAQQEPFQLDEQAKRLHGLLLRRKWPVRLALVPGACHQDLLTGIDARRTVREPGTDAVLGTCPDLLGSFIATFLQEVESGAFGRVFQKAWPQGWPTSGFCPDFTLSEALPEPAVQWHRDIFYVEQGDALQRLDIQVPLAHSDTPRSVLFYVHGGGWRAGSKRMVHGLAELAAEQDMVLVAVDYRLAPAFRMPDLAFDVAAALDWVMRNIGRYGGDAGKLALVGVSAGAHLVALLATAPHLCAGLTTSPVRGVIAISGIYDLEDFAEPGVLPSRVEQAMAESGRQALRDYSPALLVTRGKPLPPFLITFTDADLPYLDRQAVQFFDRLSETGVDCRLQVIADRDHFNQTVGIGRSIGLYDDTLGPAIVEFLHGIELLPNSDPGNSGQGRGGPRTAKP